MSTDGTRSLGAHNRSRLIGRDNRTMATLNLGKGRELGGLINYEISIGRDSSRLSSKDPCSAAGTVDINENICMVSLLSLHRFNGRI